MELNAMRNLLLQPPIYENIIKRYGKYTKKVNGELVKIVYDWFEREDGNQYKLGLIKQQYDQIKSIIYPINISGESLPFDRFCDVLIPVLTGGEHDYHDDYSIWLIFRCIDRNNDRSIQVTELETLIHIIAKSVGREQIRYLIDKVDWDRNGQLDYNEFREFIIRGYARELLMMDITTEIVYSVHNMAIPIKNN